MSLDDVMVYKSGPKFIMTRLVEYKAQGWKNLHYVCTLREFIERKIAIKNTSSYLNLDKNK